jgi:beta-mannanase
MVASGCGSSVLRLGWEFNGRFTAWAAGGHERQFASYWRRIVTVLRAVPGAHFRYDWSVLAGNANADVEAAWPGDAWVDYVGLDAYDTARSGHDPAGRWFEQVHRPNGLEWHARFASAHHKPLTFPEWGLSLRPHDDLGGGDDESYVRNMVRWIRQHDVAYAIYFDVDAVDAEHRLERFPVARATFRRVIDALGARP